jgi:16S rRNA processing protein RimM
VARSARPALPAAVGGDEPAWPQDAVEVARVLGAWGLHGAIRVKPFAADPQALFGTKRWFVAAPVTPRPAGAPAVALPRLLRIVQAREQGDSIVASAQELPDRDAAEAMKGARLFVSRASFPTPAEGEFYWVDLIGLRVVNRQQQVLGTVEGLIETGPHCVLSLRGGDAARAPTLIPFVDAYVDRVDRERGVIEVDWDEDD